MIHHHLKLLFELFVFEVDDVINIRNMRICLKIKYY